MFYLRVCIIGVHALQFKLFHWKTYFTGGHILLDDSTYRWTPLYEDRFYWRVCIRAVVPNLWVMTPMGSWCIFLVVMEGFKKCWSDVYLIFF